MANFQALTPVGRIVQGDPYVGFHNTDDKKQLKYNEDGTPEMTYMVSLALDKRNPEVAPFLAQIMAEAKSLFPSQFDAAGNCINPNFSSKIIDGDVGVDANGKANNSKPGFAGHYILKIAGKYPIKCYTRQNQELKPDDKHADQVYPGCFVVVAISVQSNGWKPGEMTKPGIKVYPQAVRFVGHGEPMARGINPDQAFAEAANRFVPAGMSATPLAGAGNALPAAMTLPGATPAPLALAPAVAAPQYVTVEPAAQGQPLSAWLAAHTPEALLAAGVIAPAPVAAPALTLGNQPQLQAPLTPAPALQPAALAVAAPALTLATPAPNFTANALAVAPQYVMDPVLSQGATREQWNAQGYDDAKLLAAGVMKQV